MSTRTLLIAGLIGPFVFHGLGAIVALGWPGYDPIARSISSMVHAPLGWLQTVAFATGVPITAAWAVGAARVIGSSRRDAAIVWALFLLQAAISLAFTVLPTDAAGAPKTTVGALHLATFYVYAVVTPISIAWCARILGRDPRWPGAKARSLVAAALMLVATALVPLTVDGPLEPWLGLLERVYVAIPGLWQVWLAWRALRVAEGLPSSAAGA